MVNLQKRLNFTWVVTLALLALLLSLLAVNGIALAQQFNWQGQIDALPTGAGSGQWVVNGRSFTASSSTEFRTDKGPFAVGVCVEVEYTGATEPFTATKIASKNSDDCSSAAATQTSTPDATVSPTPDASLTPGGERAVKGRVEALPANGLVGDWTINGVRYTATANTRFRQEKGPLVMSACVEVEFIGANAPFTATKIQSASVDDCQAATTATPGATPSPTPTPAGEREIYGRVESLPSGLIGQWQITGVSYTATAATEFKQEYGAFAVGVCVKIHVQAATIGEIETEQDFRCSSGGNTEGELYGILQSLPAGLTGDWNIGGMTFVVDAQTQLKQGRGAFAMGVTVKVHFVVGSDGRNLARAIETQFANDDSGADKDGNGSYDGAEGQAFGRIDALPANLVGGWTIGGLPYTTTAATKFKQEDGAFAQGVNVKVEFFRDGQGNRIAHEIETTSNNGGVADSAHAKLAGYIQSMPGSGFVGAWKIGDVNFSADVSAQFKEDHGLLALGAYVTVEYFLANGMNQIHEIETQVLPGGGDSLRVGKIESVGQVRSAGAMANQTWRVAGVDYTITPATILNDSSSSLAVGSEAVVNSYTATDGSQVATRIQGITLDTFLYLPVVQR